MPIQAANASPDPAEIRAAAIAVARFRAALDWMLTNPDWEGGIALAMAELGLKGRRQGIAHRKAALSLPLESKHEAIRRALGQGLRRPTRQVAAKLARLWGDAKASASSSTERLSDKLWQEAAQRLALRMSARYDGYKRAQLTLFASFSPDAARAADRLCRNPSRRDDARQEARIALLQTIDRIDPDQAFAPYAKQWIHRAVSNFLLRERLPVKAPVNLLSKALAASVDLATDSALARLGRGLREGALQLDDDSTGAAELLLAAQRDQEQRGPADETESADRRQQVASALATLTEKQRYVLALRFGLGENGGARSLAQVALAVGISRQQVSQREQRALRRLQECLVELRPEGIARA